MDKNLTIYTAKCKHKALCLNKNGGNIICKVYDTLSDRLILEIDIDNDKLDMLCNRDVCSSRYAGERVILSLYLTGYKRCKHIEIYYKDNVYTFLVSGSVINDFLNLNPYDKTKREVAAW